MFHTQSDLKLLLLCLRYCVEHRPCGDSGAAEPDAERCADHPSGRGSQREQGGSRSGGFQSKFYSDFKASISVAHVVLLCY